MADTFNHEYTVVINNKGEYEIQGSNAAQTAITVDDNIISATGDKSYELGDVASDTFKIGNTTYTYVGTPTGVKNNLNLNGGFLAQGPNGLVLFTDTEIKSKPTFTGYQSTKTVICFMPGTRIATPEGDLAVELLQRGDLVRTVDGCDVPVRWVGRQTISMTFADPLRVLPICIKAGALAENVPSRDLYVSPDHAILVDDILVHASALVNSTSIVRARAPAPTFTYYHVELADHSLLLAENVPAESFIDNVDRLAFDNWDEHEALGDEAVPLVEMAYPRAKAARQVPMAMRERLAARGQALFGPVATQAA